MTNFILCLWLAYSPASLTPLGQYADADACAAAKLVDVQASVRAGMGGGATYFCQPGNYCLPRHAPPDIIKVVTTRAILEGK